MSIFIKLFFEKKINFFLFFIYTFGLSDFQTALKIKRVIFNTGSGAGAGVFGLSDFQTN